jgi:signal transduction histidine kinase
MRLGDIRKRRPRFLSARALGGIPLGLAIAGLVLSVAGARASFLTFVLACTVAGYLAGVIAALALQERDDIAYILRLRDELRRSQDHIMETATFRALADYLEIAAHQMRGPFEAVQTEARALTTDPALPETVRERAMALRARVVELGETLRHLASYSLTRPGRAPFSVNHLLREAIQLCRHRAEEKGIRFEERYGVVPPVMGPATRTEQAIQSVIVNAVEAMPHGGGMITVATTLEGERVVARVRDTGVGIRPEHLPKVFDPFFTTKPEKAGVGLGLWAAKQTFDLIGADIAVSSAALQGTEVTMRFPQAAPLRPGRTGTDHPPELDRNTAEEIDRRIA